jgi:hypothetical protein
MATDVTQLCGRRIALPKPDCTVRVSECQDGVRMAQNKNAHMKWAFAEAKNRFQFGCAVGYEPVFSCA